VSIITSSRRDTRVRMLQDDNDVICNHINNNKTRKYRYYIQICIHPRACEYKLFIESTSYRML